MKQAQTWSLDIMLAAILFIGTVLLFFGILSYGSDSKVNELKQDASQIIVDAGSDSPPLGIVNESEVNVARLEALANESYESIKQRLRVTNDFCIFFEDESGNIIHITPNRTGIGASTINVSDIPCS